MAHVNNVTRLWHFLNVSDSGYLSHPSSTQSDHGYQASPVGWGWGLGGVGVVVSRDIMKLYGQIIE